MNEHHEVTDSIPMMLVLIRPAQANRYADDLTAAFTAPAEQPQLATPCDPVRKRYRRRRVGRRAIYFRTTDRGYNGEPSPSRGGIA